MALPKRRPIDRPANNPFTKSINTLRDGPKVQGGGQIRKHLKASRAESKAMGKKDAKLYG